MTLTQTIMDEFKRDELLRETKEAQNDWMTDDMKMWIDDNMEEITDWYDPRKPDEVGDWTVCPACEEVVHTTYYESKSGLEPECYDCTLQRLVEDYDDAMNG